MAERKTLIEGLDIDVAERPLEEQFVYGDKRRVLHGPPPSDPVAPPALPLAAVPPPSSEKYKPNPLTGVGRVPVGARIRTELAAALKRASLERQLAGVEPNSVQDILEEALAPWLRTNGYLS